MARVLVNTVGNGELDLSGNGYLIMSNGLIIQWGTINPVPFGSTSPPSLSYSFPIAFPNACFSFNGSHGGQVSTAGDLSVGFSNTSFGMRYRENLSQPGWWIAVGY